MGHAKKKKKKGTKNRTSVSVTDLESYLKYAPFPEKEIEKFASLVSIHFRQRRHRLVDPDGASGKAVIDGLVVCGILHDDSSKQVKEVTFEQSKVGMEDGEKTTIIIKEV